MKLFKMLMMAALTILAVSVFAQKNTGRSSKEQMKMKVMQIQFAGTGEYATPGTFVSLSAKEQMKVIIMKLNTVAANPELASGKSGKCTDCLALQNLSPKEQMKMKVMDLYTCPMRSGITGVQSSKCGICGMNLSAAKSKL